MPQETAIKTFAHVPGDAESTPRSEADCRMRKAVSHIEPGPSSRLQCKKPG